MTTGTVRQRTPGAPADLLRAMARPGFPVSRWSLRAITYTATTMVIGIAAMAVAFPLYGPWLLVVVALGLAAYGVFCWFDAKYHRV